MSRDTDMFPTHDVVDDLDANGDPVASPSYFDGFPGEAPDEPTDDGGDDDDGS